MSHSPLTDTPARGTVDSRDATAPDGHLRITLGWLRPDDDDEGATPRRTFDLTLERSQIAHGLWERLREVLRDAGLCESPHQALLFYVVDGARVVYCPEGASQSTRRAQEERYITVRLVNPTDEDTRKYVLSKHDHVIINAQETGADFCGNFKYDPESVNAFGLKGERAPFAHGARCADRTAATYREHVRLKVCLECLDCILVPEDCTGNYWHQLDDLVQGNRHADSVIDAFPYLACHELLRVLDVAARLDSIDIEWTNDVFEYQACISLCSSPHRRFPSAVSFIKKQFDAFAQNVRTDSEIRARIGFDREGYMSLFCGAAKTYPRAFMSRPSTLRDAALLYAGTILPVEVLDIRDFTEALDALAVGPVPCVWIDRAEFNLDDHEEWSNAKDLFDRASLLDCLAKRFRFQDPEFIRTHHIRLLLFKNEGVDRSLLVRFKVCATVDDMPDEIEPRQQTFAQLADIYVDMDHADTYLVGKLEGALFDVPHLWVESRCAAGTKRVFSHMTLNANTVQSLNDNAPIARLVSEYKEAAGKGDRGPMHVVLCLRYSKRLCSNTLCYKFVETRRS